MKGSGLGLLPMNGRRDRDEESLVLFKELHKREKDRLASLLQPISDEFDPKAGSSALYRIASGKKGSGYEFFGENNKNDYDWLKTPPATPLFPSLEMEANAPHIPLVVQREIPILQPLSRFASNAEALKGSTPTSKSPKSKSTSKLNMVPHGQSQRPSIVENKQPHINMNMKTAKVTTTQTNLSVQESKTKTTSRGVSPSVRSRIMGYSTETPPNLRTNRATSATRGRPNSTVHQKSDANPTIHQWSTRQSCCPSVTRGRKESEGILATQTKKVQMGMGNNSQFFGSRMVERVLNARKLGDPKSKPQTPTSSSWNNGRVVGGFVRTIPKT